MKGVLQQLGDSHPEVTGLLEAPGNWEQRGRSPRHGAPLGPGSDEFRATPSRTIGTDCLGDMTCDGKVRQGVVCDHLS